MARCFPIPDGESWEFPSDDFMVSANMYFSCQDPGILTPDDADVTTFANGSLIRTGRIPEKSLSDFMMRDINNT